MSHHHGHNHDDPNHKSHETHWQKSEIKLQEGRVFQVFEKKNLNSPLAKYIMEYNENKAKARGKFH